jgi:heptosyltransferase I
VAARLARERGAAIVLTGSTGDRPLVASLAGMLPPGVPTVNLAGELPLPVLAAVLQRLAVFVTGDTGPMHLAAAMGTPVAALFGPSDPARYAPHGTAARVVRVDLPCSPCNRIRLPPERCRGHVPDCLDGIPVEAVVRTATAVMRPVPSGPPPPAAAGEDM